MTKLLSKNQSIFYFDRMLMVINYVMGLKIRNLHFLLLIADLSILYVL